MLSGMSASVRTTGTTSIPTSASRPARWGSEYMKSRKVAAAPMFLLAALTQKVPPTPREYRGYGTESESAGGEAKEYCEGLAETFQPEFDAGLVPPLIAR